MRACCQQNHNQHGFVVFRFKSTINGDVPANPVLNMLPEQCRTHACKYKTHGIFLHYKPHLFAGKLKWTPGSKALHTLHHNVRDMHKVLNMDNVREEHLQQGSKSKIPVACRKCKYEWSPTVQSVVNRGSDCPNCTDRVQSNDWL